MYYSPTTRRQPSDFGRHEEMTEFDESAIQYSATASPRGIEEDVHSYRGGGIMSSSIPVDNAPQLLVRKASMLSVVSEAADNTPSTTPQHKPAVGGFLQAAVGRSHHSAMDSSNGSRNERSVSPGPAAPRSPAQSQLSRIPSMAGDREPSLGRKRSTFRQTALSNAVVAGRREGVHRPLMSRNFPQPKVDSIGIIEGFINFFRCDNSMTREKLPCSDTNDEYMHLRLMTEEEKETIYATYGEDEVTNTIVLAPALLIGFLLAVVIYCGIIVFWAPDTRLYEAGGLPWKGGEVNASEAFLPMVMALLYVAAITYANTLQISFTMFERQFKIEPEVLSSLQGRDVLFGPSALAILAGLNQTSKVPFVRQSIVKKIRWYVQEGRDSLPADLYISYINSLAVTSCVKSYKLSSMTSVANIGLPLIIALAPMSARLFAGGSVWGNGLAEEFGLAVCGPVLTFVCCYGIVAMLNLFAFTMKFHRRRMQWLTMALPDPTRPTESLWPTISFDTLENVLIWHRLRTAVSKPPMALYLWGRRLSEATFILFVLLVLLSMAYNFVNQQPSIYDGTTAITIALLITLAPVLLYIFYTPLKCVFMQEEHVDVLSRILLLSVRDIGLERGRAGVTDESLQKILDIRSAIKIVSRSIVAESEVLTFLGFPLTVYTMLFMSTCFTLATGLVLMRGVYANEAFI